MNTNTSFCMQIEKEEKKPFEEKRERERGEREMRIVFCWSNRLLLLTRRHTERKKKEDEEERTHHYSCHYSFFSEYQKTVRDDKR